MEIFLSADKGTFFVVDRCRQSGRYLNRVELHTGRFSLAVEQQEPSGCSVKNQCWYAGTERLSQRMHLWMARFCKAICIENLRECVVIFASIFIHQ